MDAPRRDVHRGMLAACMAAGLGGCAAIPSRPEEGGARPSFPASGLSTVALLDRVTWGADPVTVSEAGRLGPRAWLRAQLASTGDDRLPADAQRQIDAMEISQRSMVELAREVDQLRRDGATLPDEAARIDALRQRQVRLSQFGRETANRFLLRALYSRHQLRERMVWFWSNHFNVHQYKADIRVMVGDYEEQAIRQHALGRFGDLLEAATLHPAMLRYLDNAQNAAGRINENHARELMELHTLGVDGGYSQQDVQELARILTGAGLRIDDGMPAMRPAVQRYYRRQGLYEFNPGRHDFGAKKLLGERVGPTGQGEIEVALQRLARHPSTARFISRKLARYFVSDSPSQALVERLAARYQASDGSIAAVLEALFDSAEFERSLGARFKDPMHFVLSSLRMAYAESTVAGRVITNPSPIQGWLARLGEPLHGHQSPDGYPLDEASWASSGQMMARFEVARAMGVSSAGLMRGEGSPPNDRPGYPELRTELFYQAYRPRLGAATLLALDQARTPQEWNTLLLCSPEMMRH